MDPIIAFGGKKVKKIIRLFLAALGGYGCLYLAGIAGVAQSFFSVMGIFLIPVIYLLLSKAEKLLSELPDKKIRNRRILFSAFVSFFFSLAMLLGYQLQNYGLTDAGVKGKGLLLIRALFLGVAVFPFGVWLYEGFDRIEKGRKRKPDGKRWKNGAVFGISALIVFLCLIPVWMAYYPVIMSYDFHRQINEAARGFIWFNPYQPLAHTWIIWCFFRLGCLMGDLEAGMAGMALLQMLLYALLAGYACSFIYRVSGRKWMTAAAVLYFGIFPLNTVMVLCTTKDVLFSILFLLFCLLMLERTFYARGKKKLLLDMALVLEGCLMMQFRNNAIYAFVVFGIFWVIFSEKREKLRVLILCVLLVASGKGLSWGITRALKTQVGIARVEMYSVPIQQFARVGYCHGEDLDPETWQLLDKYVSHELWDVYNPPIADTVKISVAVDNFAESWEGHEWQLLKDWAEIGVRYPNEYIDAFLELTRGYWFPDDRSYAECLGWGDESRMGILYTYNSAKIEKGPDIVHTSKFPWLEKQLEKVVSGNGFYKWPVVSLLFKASFYCWGLVLVFTAYVFLRRKKEAIVCAWPLLYMATMLLGPVVCIRYVFPVMVVLPLLLSLLWKREL